MTTTPDRPPEDPVPSTAPGPSSDAVETAELVDQDVLSDAAGILDDAAERDLEPADLAAMDALDSPRRLLLVHAHPDDETIANGATMARYAAAGAHVTLVTCTRGERGEVVEPELAHLQGDDAALAAHRTMELATAMEALGVEDHRFLDDAHLASEDATAAPAAHYEDSGMVWGEGGRVAVAAPDTGPSAFSRADPREAAARLAGLLRTERPQVLVTYEAGGGYGHPDHVRAHEVAVLAVALAADPTSAGVAGSEPWTVAKVYETVLPRSALAQLGAGGAEAAAGTGAGGTGAEGTGAEGTGAEGRGAMSMVVDDDEVTAVVDAPEQRAAKAAALRAHASQVRFREAPPGVPGPFQFSVGQDVWLPVTTTEHYRLRADSPAPAAPGEGGVETDLFAGVAL